MSSRIDFYEVREGTEDDWEHVCLCKTEADATRVITALQHVDTAGLSWFIEHVEIVAEVDLDIRDY